MSKFFIEYDPSTGCLTDDSGLVISTYIGANLTPAGDQAATGQASETLELVKQGLTADDLVKLRNIGVI